MLTSIVSIFTSPKISFHHIEHQEGVFFGQIERWKVKGPSNILLFSIRIMMAFYFPGRLEDTVIIIL